MTRFINKLPLKLRLLLFIVTISFLSIVVVALISYQQSQKALSELSISQLESQGTMMKDNLEGYLNRTVNFTNKLSRDRLVEGMLIAYESGFYGDSFDAGKDLDIYTPSYQKLDKRYLNRKEKILKEFEINDFFLVTIDSQIVFTANNKNRKSYLGKNLANGQYKGSPLGNCYLNAKKSKDGSVVFTDFFYNNISDATDAYLCVQTLAEFANMDEGIEKGDFIGVLVVKLDTKKINKLMTQRTGMGRTGQAYLVGSDFKLRTDFFLNSKKYNSNNSLKKGILIDSESIKLGLSGKSGIILTTDITGEKVLSFHTPFKYMGKTYTVIADKQEKEIFQRIDNMLLFIGVSSLIYGVIVIFLAIYIVGVIVKPITSANDSLKTISNDLAAGSNSLSSSSDELSDGAESIASSIQETMATMDELSAMVDQNLNNVRESNNSSGEMSKTADEGMKAISNMILAMDDISENNDSVVNVMNDVVGQMTEFKQVITEISEKTNVINDIVFQTKLLSFNASVEAARAGEQGKGFAVVAEEVGNLATASGKAATEIFNLLQENIQKVENQVNETVNKVEGIKEVGTDKVTQGKDTASTCQTVLTDIGDKVKIVASKIQEINVASNEQANGISEVSVAMRSLDEIANSTTTIAAQNTNSSESISQKAVDLNGIFVELNELVNGKTGDEETISSKNKKNHSSKKSEKNNPKKLEVVKAKKPVNKNDDPSRDHHKVPNADDDNFVDIV